MESVHLRNHGAVSPSDTVTAGPPRHRHKKQIPPARSRPRGPRRKTVPLREAPAGRPIRGRGGECPPGLRPEPRAQPGMHALCLRRDRRGHSHTCPRRRRRPHTDSSVDSSNGLMYSKPSNSDWSILFMTSLCAQAERGDPCQPPPSPPPTGTGKMADRASRPSQLPPQALLIIRGQLHRLAGELGVEVVQTVLVGYLRLEWREGLLLLQLGRTTREVRSILSVISTGFRFFQGLKSQNRTGRHSVFKEVVYLKASFLFS